MSSNETARQSIAECLKQANEVLYLHPKNALKKARKAEKLCKQLQLGEHDVAETLVQSLNIQTKALWQLRDYGQALEVVHASREQSEHIPATSSLQTDILYVAATTYFFLGDYSKALTYYQNMLALAQQLADVPRVFAARNGIGAAFGEMGNHLNAIEQFQKILEKQDNAQVSIRWRIVYTRNILAGYREVGRPEKSVPFGSELLALIEHEEATTSDKVGALSELGKLYFTLGEYEEAEKFYVKAHPMIDDAKGKEPIFFSLNYARLLLKLKRLTEAQTFLELALQLVNTLDDKPFLAACYELSAQIAAAMMDFEKAYSHHVKFHQLQSEMRSEENTRKIRLLQISHEVAVAQKQQENLRFQTDYLKSKNAELVALHNEKDELFRIVAHDLRTPLSAALLTVDVLKAKASRLSDAEVRSSCGRASSALQNAVSIASQLTAVANIESDDDEAIFESLAIDQLVEKIVEEYVPIAEAKKQHLVIANLSGAIVNSHAVWIRQILSNLISNAIKYSLADATTTVNLSTNPTKNEVCIEVMDEGLGLSKKDLQKVFTKYTKLSARPTNHESSTGLGLYITKVLATKLGGAISVHSDGKGKGSIFVVTLPVRIVNEQDAATGLLQNTMEQAL